MPKPTPPAADVPVSLDEPQTFPPPPTPVAETPIAAEPTPSVYYVILHEGVDDHRKDAIVPGEKLGDAATIERLLSLGAVRPLGA